MAELCSAYPVNRRNEKALPNVLLAGPEKPKTRHERERQLWRFPISWPRFSNFSGSLRASDCSAKLLSIFYHFFVPISSPPVLLLGRKAKAPTSRAPMRFAYRLYSTLLDPNRPSLALPRPNCTFHLILPSSPEKENHAGLVRHEPALFVLAHAPSPISARHTGCNLSPSKLLTAFSPICASTRRE